MEIKVDLSKARPLEVPAPAPIVPQKNGDGPVSRIQNGVTSQPFFGHIVCECHSEVSVDKTIESRKPRGRSLVPRNRCFKL